VSVRPANEPVCSEIPSSAIALVIDGRARDLGGFSVRRVLPSIERRMVGPFVFFDHMGPVDFLAGQGIDVRPHPHIGLATITYLFEGVFSHKDSTGSNQVIVPGDVNWMIAGRGIVHSERTPPELRTSAIKLHGVQTWVALPLEHEETEPRFEHHPGRTIPVVSLPGVRLAVVAGSAYGVTAPTGVLSATLYVAAELDAGAELEVDDSHPERGVYVAEGSVECEGRSFGVGAMLVLHSNQQLSLRALEPSKVMLVGGAPLEGTREIAWNFVSSSKERLEQAKADWRAQRFAKIPNDDVEFIPLPEG
jgi:redox-sensitive bicupin YhaK (pirin superfamily)